MATYLASAPLRITLGGGGTDMPEFYRYHGGGFCLAAALQYRVRVMLHEPFELGYILHYSDTERWGSLDSIKHPVIKEILRRTNPFADRAEVFSSADIPAGTGLGQSGAFAVAFAGACKQREIAPELAAWLAVDAERSIDGRVVGLQDQFVAACGGVLAINIDDSGFVVARNLDLSDEVTQTLSKHLVMAYVGVRESSGGLLESQNHAIGLDRSRITESLKRSRAQGQEFANRLLKWEADTAWIPEMLNQQYREREVRFPDSIPPRAVKIREYGLKIGATGAKLMGAGGGGFVLFWADNPDDFLLGMESSGARMFRLTIDSSTPGLRVYQA